MSQVLVDTSVWIEMLRRGESPIVHRLGELYRDGLVCTNGVVRAEILSGARTEREYDVLFEDFSALPFLEDPPDLWQIVGEARFRLSRKGFRASVTDLVVAATASHHHKTLFSLDQAFARIKDVLPFDSMTAPGYRA